MQSVLAPDTKVPAQTGSRSAPTGRESGVPGWIWALAGVLFFAYTTLSLRLHEIFESNAYDLGIFEQVVRSYAHGQLPVSEIKGPDYPVLGDHFSPVLALLAPLYRMWPGPACLLTAQALLVAASVVPLTLWARRRLGTLAAAVIGSCYGLSWGIASAVGFDFHEWAFAVPLLALSLTALGTGRLKAAAGWSLPLLLVKEDMGFTVMVIGLLIAYRGRRKLGLGTAAAGLGGALLTLLVLLPAASAQGSFEYWHYLDASPREPATFGGLLHRGTLGLITPEPKATTLILTLAPTLFLAARSPLLWVALPTTAIRLVSNNPVHWGTAFHYSLIVMPVVFAALIDALVRRRRGADALRRVLCGCAAVTVLLLPQFPLFKLVQPATWREDPSYAVAHRLMDRIPDGASVQATNALVPHLTSRTSTALLGWAASRPRPEWILADTEPVEPYWPLSAEQLAARLEFELAHGYRVVERDGGYVLLTRTAAAPTGS